MTDQRDANRAECDTENLLPLRTCAFILAVMWPGLLVVCVFVMTQLSAFSKCCTVRCRGCQAYLPAIMVGCGFGVVGMHAVYIVPCCHDCQEA